MSPFSIKVILKRMEGNSVTDLYYIPVNVFLLIYYNITEAEKALMFFSYKENDSIMSTQIS